MFTTRHLIAAGCIALLPAAALAEKGGNGRGNGGENRAERSQGNNGNGNGNRRNADSTLDAARGNSANARANPSRGFCPPGLQRKETPCVPPGEAANGTTAEDWAAEKGYAYYPGAPLDDVELAELPNYADYGLPTLPAGESYAVIDRVAVVIDPETNTFLRVATR